MNGETNGEESFRSWVQLAVVGFIMAATQSIPTYGGPFLVAQMAGGMGFDRTQVGVLSAALMLSIGVLSFVAGATIARFGYRVSFAVGSAILAVGAAMIAGFSLSFTVIAVLFATLIGGAPAFAGVLPAVTMVSRTFSTRRTLATTIAFCMLSGGGALGIGLLTWITGPERHWRAGWWAMSAGAALALVLTLVAMREQRMTDRAGKQIQPNRPARNDAPEISVRDSFRTSTFWTLFGSACAAMIATGLVTGHSVLSLLDHGLSITQAGSAIAIFPMAGLAGKILVGVVGDRVKPAFNTGLGAFSCGLGLITMMFATTYPLAFLAVTLAGLGLGVVLVTTPLVLVSQFGSLSLPTLAGTIQGTQTVAAAAITLLAGLVYDRGAGYAPVFISAGIFCCLSAIATILSSKTQMRVGANN